MKCMHETTRKLDFNLLLNLQKKKTKNKQTSYKLKYELIKYK